MELAIIQRSLSEMEKVSKESFNGPLLVAFNKQYNYLVEAKKVAQKKYKIWQQVL